MDPEKKNQINYEEMLKLFKDPAYLSEFINNRFPVLRDTEFIRIKRERPKGPIQPKVIGAFESIVDKPVTRVAVGYGYGSGSGTGTGTGISGYGQGERGGEFTGSHYYTLLSGRKY